jgi:hypothetical protein
MTSWLPVILPTSASVRELSATELNGISAAVWALISCFLVVLSLVIAANLWVFAMLEEVFGESETGKEGATDDPV